MLKFVYFEGLIGCEIIWSCLFGVFWGFSVLLRLFVVIGLGLFGKEIRVMRSDFWFCNR